MRGKKITDILLYASIAVLLFGTGYKLGEYKIKTEIRRQIVYGQFLPAFGANIGVLPDKNFSLFWDTWEKLEQKYVDKEKLNPEKMYYGAIKGLVAALEDPYTFFLTPEENKQAKDDLGGKFEGIGAQLGLKDNRIVIIAPIKKSPAEKAGLRSGDLITKVNDELTIGWTLPKAVSKIRGPKGTTVKLTLERGEKEFDVVIQRDQIKVPSVELSFETKKNCKKDCQPIAYLKLNQFGDETNKEWDKAVSEITQRWQNKNIKGMILDLRNNPGGYLDSSVYIASEFLPQEKLIVKQEAKNITAKSYFVSRVGRLLDIPLVVIINQGSASASEILSGTLRDHKRAKLIGEKTFGKGSVQEPLDLARGAGLHVTIAKWILPKGEWINGKGIEPDIVIKNEDIDSVNIEKDNDQQLQKALELINQ